MAEESNKSMVDSLTQLSHSAQQTYLRWIANILLVVLKNALSLWLTSIAVLWSAAFIYAMFYYIYIPMVSNVRELHFQFDSKCDTNAAISGKCSTAYATLPFDQHLRNGIYFARGQLYRFSVQLILPESDINWDQGMFMIRIKLLDSKRKTVVNVAKPSILVYKTPLLRTMSTLYWSPFLVFGVMEESQTLRVTLLEQFAEGSYSNVGPISEALIEIEARQIQIYSPSLLIIEANLTGLRYYMYYYPIISALFGVAIISFFLYLFAFFSMANNKIKQIESNNVFHIENSKDDDDFNDVIENPEVSGISAALGNVSDDESDDSTVLLQNIQTDNCDAENKCDDESKQLPDSSSVE